VVSRQLTCKTIVKIQILALIKKKVAYPKSENSQGICLIWDFIGQA
jgi:hypothetical protein